MFRMRPASTLLALAFAIGGLHWVADIRAEYCPQCQGGQGQGLHGHGLHHHRTVQCRPYEYGNPDLFYNFYVNPNCGGVGAAMYVAPLPVPPHVGHVYGTYQPFLPHEFLYKHHRSYHRPYDDGRGLTRTSVHWW